MAESENIGGNDHYFEGVEKNLEIWFPLTSDKSADLRKISRNKWDELLQSVNCTILSTTKNDELEAYVLSESSMFVAKERWILKTCGQTTPLQCLPDFLELVKKFTGHKEIFKLFYSRKKFKRPQSQKFPHRDFAEEVAFLNKYFNDGVAYTFGPENDENDECWHLYTVSRGGGGENGLKHDLENMLIENIENFPMKKPTAADQTIEVLMTELDPEVMAIFTKNECSSAKEATEKSGIHKIIPGMVIDDFLFEPCGYSMNGVKKNGCYMTIHITPENEFSYVSFESNIEASSYRDIIARVIATFKPGKFVVTVFATKTSRAFSACRELKQLFAIDGWQQRHLQSLGDFDNYGFTYAHYIKFPS